MPTFTIEVKAELLNIAELRPVGDIMWTLDVESEGGEVREGVTVDPAEEIELDGSRGVANFIMKWSKQDKHQAYIQIVDLKGAITGSTDSGKKKKGKKAAGGPEAFDGIYRNPEEHEDWIAILALECRGLRPVNVHVSGKDFDAVSIKGTRFPAGDCEYEPDNEGLCWTDFDEKLDDCVGVNGLRARVVNL